MKEKQIASDLATIVYDLGSQRSESGRLESIRDLAQQAEKILTKFGKTPEDGQPVAQDNGMSTQKKVSIRTTSSITIRVQKPTAQDVELSLTDATESGEASEYIVEASIPSLPDACNLFHIGTRDPQSPTLKTWNHVDANQEEIKIAKRILTFLEQELGDGTKTTI